MTAADDKIVAELQDISKAFPGVRALHRVDMEVRRGEIHALLGENGAGKSTLIKILAGLLRPDRGHILLNGESARIRSPRDAIRRGITVIPQEVMAVPAFSAARNILLGMESPWARMSSVSGSEAEVVQTALRRSGASFNGGSPARQLSVPEIRLCQIARALIAPGELILLDEPTAVLSDADAEALIARLESFRKEGKAIIYVSHRLSEVLRIADRITVLRDGERVGTFNRADVDRDVVINLMAKTNVRMPEMTPSTNGNRADVETGPVLDVRNIVVGHHVRGVSFTARRGDIIGIAGVQGSGHGQLLAAIAGRIHADRGSVFVHGKAVGASLRSRYKGGLVLVPADRREAAIVPSLTLQDNIILPHAQPASPGLLARLGFRNRRQEREVASRFADTLLIRPPRLQAAAGGLSGGNQQKLALARALNSAPAVLLVEEPTQGIDVNAKAEIRVMLQQLAHAKQVTMVIATSEFEDLLGLADTIHVLSLGRIVASMRGDEATYEDILHHALP